MKPKSPGINHKSSSQKVNSRSAAGSGSRCVSHIPVAVKWQGLEPSTHQQCTVWTCVWQEETKRGNRERGNGIWNIYVANPFYFHVTTNYNVLNASLFLSLQVLVHQPEVPLHSSSHVIMSMEEPSSTQTLALLEVALSISSANWRLIVDTKATQAWLLCTLY